jgi:predicted RNase H-like HicB family nuclease
MVRRVRDRSIASRMPHRLESKRENHMQRNFDVVVEKDEEGYYIASVPALPGCHTQAKSRDERDRRIREAIELCLEVEGFPRVIWSSSVFNASSLQHEPKSSDHWRRTDRCP